MRRLYLSVVALGLLGAVLGCNHMHGVCDCDDRGPCGTYGSCPGYGHGELNVSHAPVTEVPIASQPLPTGVPATMAPVGPLPSATPGL